MLKQIGDKTYYIENDTNIGIYMTGPDRVCFIDTGSHGVAEENIVQILEKNEANQKMLIEAVKAACSSVGLDEIISKMYKVTKMRTNEANHALLSSTVKCYLAYLQDKGEVVSGFEDDVMVWKCVQN